MAAYNNLYPPIVDTYLPVFDKNSTYGCKVYFSLSNYNNINEIKGAQIIVHNQKNNLSMLNTTFYPSAIKLTEVQEDFTKNTDDKYYVTIEAKDLINNEFELNEYYKVQIRFSSVPNPTIYGGVQKIDSWLSENLLSFSEWSTVCLIKAILPPQVRLKNFVEDSSAGTVFSSNTVNLIGSVLFEKGEQETLRSYNIQLYDSSKKILVDTGEIFTNKYTNINEINYTFKIDLKEQEKYQIILNITTKNLYQSQHIYYFSIAKSEKSELNINYEISEDIDNDRIKIRLYGKNLNTNVIIRRTSDKTNFSIWDDICIKYINEKNDFNYIWYDATIESGVLYKYSIQSCTTDGIRGVATILNEKPIIRVFDNIYLLNNNIQLKICFDPTISTFKHTVIESKTDTIGSQYPFIRKNGNVNYREFPLNGIISFLSDENEIFTTKEEIFGNYIENYIEYNNENNITPYNDYIYEKKFRDKVISFLYENNVKLFRSATEGNILVKLMNITFTPNSVLGRRIYSFSCTAYEVADNTIENINYFNIQPIGKLQEGIVTFSDIDVEKNYSITGQIYQNGSTIFDGNINIIDILKEQIQNNAELNYSIIIQNFNYLYFSFNSNPYLIKETNSGPILANINDSNCFLGYLIYINNEPIVINEDGIYQITSSIEITSLRFAVTSDVDIHYSANIGAGKQKENIIYTSLSSTALPVVYKTIRIQWTDIFNRMVSIVDMLKNDNRYNYNNKEQYQAVIGISYLEISADQGTILYIQTENDDSPQKIIIGSTESLRIYDNVKEIYYYGQYLSSSDFIINNFSISENQWKYNNYNIVLYRINQDGFLKQIDNNSSVLINTIDAINILIDEAEMTFDFDLEIEKGEY